MDQLAYVAVWIPSLPLVVVFVAGIVLATVRLKSHRRALLFTQIGLGALILRSVVAVFSQMMVMRLRETHGSLRETAETLAAINIASYVLMFAGLLFLIVAVFADRAVTAARAE